ncbi:MAG: heavy-metal-associated domain-containing protein [Cyanobacteria bacterium P01_H01_bin.15]
MKLKLTVPNLACSACVENVTKAVQGIDSAADVAADPKTKLVVIETTAADTAIKDAITAAGYTVA